MIYTLTLNPALDYVITLEHLKTGYVNRTNSEHINYGGKGINVACVLKELEIETICLGFIAGFTGLELKKGVHDILGLKEDFICTNNGMTRINVKIKANEETEINGRGPIITKQDIELLYKQLDHLYDEDYLVLSGSIPMGVSKDIYCMIMDYLKDKDIRIVVDGSGELLMNTLPYHPFLIKPNHHELAELFNVNIHTLDEIEHYARLLQEQGAKNVLVSMGKDGSMLIDEYGNRHDRGVCTGNVVNSVGAGDSMVAGFIAGIYKGMNYSEALKLATACGGASAFSLSLAKKEDIDELLKQL